MFSVRPSKIHGRGCFSNQYIRVGTACVAPSHEIKEEQATYQTVWTDDEKPYDLYSPFCFLNHSDDPNADLYWTGDEWMLYFLRDMPADEEVTIDYGFDPADEDDPEPISDADNTPEIGY